MQDSSLWQPDIESNLLNTTAYKLIYLFYFLFKLGMPDQEEHKSIHVF